MSEGAFITLKKTDTLFNKYLLGNISSDWVPIPVETLNLHKSNESVTFRKLHKSEIKRPFLWFFNLISFELIMLTLAPVMCVGFYLNILNISYSKFDFILSLVSLLFLHMSIYCLNDYLDHMRGIDRVNDKGGSHVIQKGWVSAYAVLRLGISFMVLATSVALPLFLKNIEIFTLAVLVIFILLVGYFFSRRDLQMPLISLFILFLVFGPALTLSTEWMLIKESTANTLFLGIYFGLMTVTYVHAKQILSMVTDQSAGIKSFAIQLGIDRSVKFLRLIFMLALVFYFITFGMVSFNHSYLLSLGIVPSLIFVLKNVKQIQSPLSSHLQVTYRRLLKTYRESVILLFLSWMLF